MNAKSQIRVGIFEKNPKVWDKASRTDFSKAVVEYGVKKETRGLFRHRHIVEWGYFYCKIGRFVFENTKSYKKIFENVSKN